MAVEHLTPVAVRRRLFTADEYQRMGEVGILSENDRVELIDGEIITKMSIGPRHNACVSRATHALVTAVGSNAIVLPQGSVRVNPRSEPEPDLVLLRPRPDFYASRLAGPADILLIVEIAQSSIDFDRTVKAGLYARCGVTEYWLADLNANALFCYSEPRGESYQTIQQYHRGDTIAPQLLPDCTIAVDVLLTE